MIIDFESRKVIEALRSGVSSKGTSQYFSSARPAVISKMTGLFEKAEQMGTGDSMFISGKYGEGKTQLLNTAFNMAHEKNMVVSHICLSKETPFDKLHLVYKKVLSGTYLPGRMQPGIEHIFADMTANSPIAYKLFEYCLKDMQVNKLYYILKAALSSEDYEEKFRLLNDIEGDFITNVDLKKIYKRIFAEKTDFNTAFTKTNHCFEYFKFLSFLFKQMGYSAWIILIDEVELVGRLGKKARLLSYDNIAKFTLRNSELHSTVSMFAIAASFSEDVIEGKHEIENLSQSNLSDEQKSNIADVLERILREKQLTPIESDELRDILEKLIRLHSIAYNWTPDIDALELLKTCEKSGYLLRTKIKTAIEILDGYFLYGVAPTIHIGALSTENFEESLPNLEELLCN